MLASMTGYGRAETTIAGYQVFIEVRSVNHRHLDIVLRVPREWMALEDKLRRQVTTYVARGRIEVSASVTRALDETPPVVIDHHAAERWTSAIRQLSRQLNVGDGLTARDLLQMHGVVAVVDPVLPGSAYEEPILEVVGGALSALSDMRREEGKRLAADLCDRIDRLAVCAEGIDARAEIVPAIHRDKLERRLASLIPDTSMDPGRLEQEIVLFAERSSVTEEVVRLKAHLDAMRTAITQDSPCGRRLDFLLQEVHRECNTIGAKANDLEIAQQVIEAKTLTEQLREQAQNIE